MYYSCFQITPDQQRHTQTDLIGDKQGPAEVPCLCRSLGLGQPLLGRILMLHVWVKVELVQSLVEGRGTKTEGAQRMSVTLKHQDSSMDIIVIHLMINASTSLSCFAMIPGFSFPLKLILSQTFHTSSTKLEVLSLIWERY